MSRVDTYIDFTSFNQSNFVIRHIDILTDMLGGVFPMESLGRIIYIDVMYSSKPQPRQDFSICKKQLKYAKIPSLKNFKIHTKDNYTFPAPQTHSLGCDFNSISNLNLLSQRVLMHNINTNLNMTKQSRWAWKNNMLSDDFIIRNLAVTNVKKLLGNSANTTSLTSRNI